MDLDRTEMDLRFIRAGREYQNFFLEYNWPGNIGGLKEPWPRSTMNARYGGIAVSSAVSNGETVFCGERGSGAHGMKKRGLCGHRR
jgi:transcriptional regulator with AAA-type ATPase domain